jgi:peptide/nickel transport system substrate-binding protein
MPQGEIRPGMVDRTEISADRLSYSFTLRDGLKWHDGLPVRADDCVASIKRWAACDTTGQKLMTFVADVVACDTKTLSLRLKEPTDLVLPSQIEDATGSGPFIFRQDLWRPAGMPT